MNSYADLSRSQSASTLATTAAREDDDEVTLIGRPQRLNGNQILTMAPDDVRNTKFFNSEDPVNVQYTVTTESVNSATKECLESVLTDYMGNVRQLSLQYPPMCLKLYRLLVYTLPLWQASEARN